MRIFGYECSITKAKPKTKQGKVKTTGYSSKTWSKEDIAKLIDMYNRGKTNVGMSRMIGRTTAAITSKLWKLKRDGIIS